MAIVNLKDTTENLKKELKEISKINFAQRGSAYLLCDCLEKKKQILEELKRRNVKSR